MLNWCVQCGPARTRPSIGCKKPDILYFQTITLWPARLTLTLELMTHRSTGSSFHTMQKAGTVAGKAWKTAFKQYKRLLEGGRE